MGNLTEFAIHLARGGCRCSLPTVYLVVEMTRVNTVLVTTLMIVSMSLYMEVLQSVLVTVLMSVANDVGGSLLCS